MVSLRQLFLLIGAVTLYGCSQPKQFEMIDTVLASAVQDKDIPGVIAMAADSSGDAV